MRDQYNIMIIRIDNTSTRLRLIISVLGLVAAVVALVAAILGLVTL